MLSLMPPLFGLNAARISLGWYPAFLGMFGLLVLLMTEHLNRTVEKAG